MNSFEITKLYTNGLLSAIGGIGQSLEYYNESLYILGNTGDSINFYQFSLKTNQLSVLTLKGVPIMQMCCYYTAVINSSFIVFSGYHPAKWITNMKFYSISFESLETQVISESADFSLGYSGILVANNSVLVGGGRSMTTGQNRISKVSIFPNFQATELAPSWKFPPSRKNHAMHLLGKYFYIFGGVFKGN